MKVLEKIVGLGFDEVAIILHALEKHESYVAELARLAHNKWLDEKDLDRNMQNENREILDNFLEEMKKIRQIKEKLRDVKENITNRKMKKFYFEKTDSNSILATYGGYTNEYTPDGEVNTSLEYTMHNNITQEKAEELLNQFGWFICEECGNIFVDGGDCENCIAISWKNVEFIKEYIEGSISENGLDENDQIELEFSDFGETEEIRIAASQLGYEVESGEGAGMYWIYIPE